MKLISEIIHDKLIEEQTNFEWNQYTHNIINDLIKLCIDLKGQELRNIEAALRHGYMMSERWSLELETYDHILMRYDEEIMTYEEFEKAKSKYLQMKKD